MRHYFYHTDLGQQNAVFHNFAIQIAIIQYSGRSKHAWALAKPLKKNFQNHPYGQPVLTFAVLAVASVWTNINRVTLQHNKEFIMSIFILTWFNERHFEYSGKRCSLNVWKQSAQRLKLQERLLTINKRKYNSVKHLQRQQFSFRKTNIKVSLKILSLRA